jgi:uncharacterized membrane protein YhaH (DUF805 family)
VLAQGCLAPDWTYPVDGGKVPASTTQQGVRFMDWMLMPLRRYADFSGRSRRKEYWMFALGIFIVYVVLFTLVMMGGLFSSMADPATPPQISTIGWIGIGLLGIVALAIFIPSLAVVVRRLHDQDKSGWFILIQFIPYIGGIIMLIFMCIEGTKGENRFGPDPKGENIADVFA